MREIKFRGYNEINKKMLNWNELLYTNLKNIFTMQKKDTGIILMQYTGLHDKNGKEIYEGDILNFDDEYWVVSYDYGKFIGTFNNVSEDLYEISNYEIVGNIYDNKDLVENGAENE